MTRHRLLYTGRRYGNHSSPAALDKNRGDLAQHIERAMKLVLVSFRPTLILSLVQEVSHRTRGAWRVEYQNVHAASAAQVVRQSDNIFPAGQISHYRFCE